jgi:hypothetical protein
MSDEILIRDKDNEITHVFKRGKLYVYKNGVETLVKDNTNICTCDKCFTARLKREKEEENKQ